MCAGDYAERDGNRNRDEHRGDGQGNGCRIALEYEFADGPIVAKRETHVAVQQRGPVIDVAIIRSVPDEVALTVVVLGKREEERRAIESVLFAKLLKLFRGRLFTKNGDSGIARDEFD